MHKAKKKVQLNSSKRNLGALVSGFGLYFLAAYLIRTRLDQSSTDSKVEVLLIGVIFSGSLLLIASTAYSIITRIRSELATDELISQEKLVGGLTLGSLMAAVATLFLPLLSAAALVLGIISIRNSYYKASNESQNMRNYRAISFVSVFATAIGIFLAAITS